jgi:2-furoyl-CoA dehydrogenase large subunit
VRIDKYVSAHDCGTILNPGLAEGQIHGSFAAAVGATLFEEFAYAEDGSFLSGTFADYLVITAPELPKLDLVNPTANPSPYTRLGAKGIAEGNQYSTPVCVANAVADALGREDVSVPLTPAKVFEWIHGEETPPPDTVAAKPKKKKRERAIEGQGEAFVPAPPDEVWATLLDPDSLAKVIPGCRELEKVAENAYRASVDMGVGPVRGRFEANVALSDLTPPRSAKLSGDLAGALGASHGSGTVTLKAAEGGTDVTYDYTVHLTGKVAAVGGRMLDGAARLLIGQFFKALVKQAANGGRDGDGK